MAVSRAVGPSSSLATRMNLLGAGFLTSGFGWLCDVWACVGARNATDRRATRNHDRRRNANMIGSSGRPNLVSWLFARRAATFDRTRPRPERRAIWSAALPPLLFCVL